MPKKAKFENKPLKQSPCVCTNLKMASRMATRGYDQALEELGINITQYSILVNVLRYQPISQMRLAEHLNTERTTLYRALDILEKRKLLKTTATGEGLAKIIELTAQGKDLTLRAEKRWSAFQARFIKDFGSEKWSQLSGLLDELREHFKEAL